MTEPTETPAGTKTEVTEPKVEPTTTEVKPTGTEEPTKPATEEPKAGEDYEARFKGLQPKVQELAEANKSLTGERLTHLGKISELELTLDAEVKKTEQSAKDADAAAKAQEESQGTIDTLQAKLDRQALIMSDFPDLAVMEAKGLIDPGLKGDDLKLKLSEMRLILQTKGESAVGSLVAGSTSVEEAVTGARTQGDTVSDVDQLIQAALKAGDFKEVDRLEGILIDRANKEVFNQGGAPAV